MIRAYTAHTSEIDDAEIAISEILEQLEPEKNCLKNTVAVVSCYHEFATNGIVAELYKKLKCPIIGATSSLVATNQGSGQLDFAIMMITSDDVTLTAACSSSLINESEAPLSEMYNNALEGHTEKPKLILSTAPFLMNHAGDNYIDILTKSSGGIPNFGTFALNESINYEDSYVIYNDKVEHDIYSVIVASGNINPRFLHASISPEKILNRDAIITKSEGNLLKEVNGLPVYDYLETLGMVSNGKIRDGLLSIPLILNYTGGERPIARGLLAVNEEGYGVCGGLMSEGSKLAIGAWDKEDVVRTTLQTIENALSDESINAFFMYSCIVRNMVLETDIFAEAHNAGEAIADRIPYLFAYAGGEICPVGDTTYTNYFHNNTFIGCAF